MEQIHVNKYAIFKKVEKNEYYLWTSSEADSTKKLLALLRTLSDHFGVKVSENVLVELEELGWDVKHFNYPPLEANTVICSE